jgi:para-aminobenzoate synthetase
MTKAPQRLSNPFLPLHDFAVAMLIPKPLILFIDAYDSFSNNIISLLETTLNVSVRTVKIDNEVLLGSDEALKEELGHYAAVVCGPGPGHPEREEDVGIIRRIWRLGHEDLLPVLGICLGFQSLCLEFGGEVKRLKGPQHGIIRRISHIGEIGEEHAGTIFDGVGEIHATLYQSLCADDGQDDIPGASWNTEKWNTTKKCPELLPLAWAESNLSEESDSGVKDDRVLVAVQHRTKPFFALQYHPESICTNDESKIVFNNWFKQAMLFNQTSRQTRIKKGSHLHGAFATRESLLSRSERFQPMNGNPNFPIHSQHHTDCREDLRARDICHSHIIDLPENVSVADIISPMKGVVGMARNHILLESSNADENATGTADVRGRYSILALDVDFSLRFEYTTGCNIITAIYPGHQPDRHTTDLRQYGGVWPFLAQYLNKKRVAQGNEDSPFWGGFMGYTTYELGLEGIDVPPSGRSGQQHSRPDLCFAWVTRSLVIDHVKKQIHVQEISPASERPRFEAWQRLMCQTLSRCGVSPYPKGFIPPPPCNPLPSTITLPNNGDYESKVSQCQEQIRNGNAYELCLTAQTTITRPRISMWPLYKALRTSQPAPFSSYICLGSAVLISSSPERFLSWDASGKCELRPMKGTVRKSPAVRTLSQAKELLDVPKEKAENLMIVDLVRHDLHGVCGSGNVTVPRLMVVEEYASVFQMISVVQGQIPSPITKHMNQKEIEEAKKTRYTGIDVLAASLPPGSMTGAPKKRSCEILQQIEGGQERSLYSGVVGYMDVGGRGDFSVTIRSMFRWTDEDSVGPNGMPLETWHIGAGGAVTALSTPEGEREEMQTKLAGTLGVFE